MATVKKKRKKGNSKKGGALEREFAKQLSLWYSGGEYHDYFRRSTNSGGMATVRHAKGERILNEFGDIVYRHMDGVSLMHYVTLELKRGYGTWSIMDCLDAPLAKSNQKARPKQKIEKFLEQVTGDAEKAGVPYPILVSKRDKRQEVITYPVELYNELTDYCGDSRKLAIDPEILIRFEYKGKTWVSQKLSEFFDWANPEFFKQRYTKETNK